MAGGIAGNAIFDEGDFAISFHVIFFFCKNFHVQRAS